MPQIALRIDSDLGSVNLVGLCARHCAELSGFDSQAALQIELAVVEAVTNSIRHAYRLQAGNVVDVQIVGEEGAIEATVTDRGESPPANLYDPREIELPETLAEGGRGRFLIVTLMDEVELMVRDGNNTLRLTKRQ